jgi:hypothetical protein
MGFSSFIFPPHDGQSRFRTARHFGEIVGVTEFARLQCGMRFRIVVLLQLLLAAFAARADELLPLLKVGTEVYTNANVTTITATDIYFHTDKGMGTAKLKDLDAELQKHFHYNPAKMAAAEKEKAAGDTLASALTPFDPIVDNTNAQSVKEEAVRRVKIIVNQPVRKFARSSAMQDVSRYIEGWFHPGASTPDYNNVDIRTTQELPYQAHTYVTSDLNPGIVFSGAELEFNSNTKLFYADRSLPKKKLTEAEMVEINRLYRIIGKCQDTLHPVITDQMVTNEVTAETDPVPNPPMFSRDYLSMHKKQLMIFGGALLVIAIVLQLVSKKRPS